MKRLSMILLCAMLFLTATPLCAQANEKYTLVYSRETVDTKPLVDQDRSTVWKTKRVKSAKLLFTLPKDCYGLYFSTQNGAKTIRISLPDENGKLKQVSESSQERLQFVLPLPEGTQGQAQVELVFSQAQALVIDTLLVLDTKEAASGLAVWENADVADVLMLMGETTLSADQEKAIQELEQMGKTVQLAVLPKLSGDETLALLDRLSYFGCLYYPALLEFKSPSKPPKDEKALLKLWGQKKLDEQIASLIRQYQPIAVLSPMKGEVVGQTLLAAASRAVALSADNAWVNDDLDQLALWSPKQVLSADEQVATLPSREQAQDEFLRTLKSGYAADYEGAVSAKGQMEELLKQPVSERTIVADVDNGLWLYRTPTLTVSILRYQDEQRPLVWYVADIMFDPEVERFGCYPHDKSLSREQEVQPEIVARENKLVFGMNSDYYQYRKYYKKTVGLIIRDGKLIYDDDDGAKKRAFPPLDTFAFYPDGSMALGAAQTKSADSFLADGARDVLSFGPILASGGNVYAPIVTSRTNKEPRCGIGQVDKGHYVAILIEGRLGGISEGCGIAELGRLLMANGCTEAINIDGGHTAAMVFMGDRITRVGTLSGRGLSRPRDMIELMGIGIDPEATGSAE